MRLRRSIPVFGLLLLVTGLLCSPCLAAVEQGNLSGAGDSFTFKIDAKYDNYFEVPFTYPKGSVDFWVKILGADESTILGDYDLDNGNIINLSGGGVFYLTIYSKRGGGNWKATYTLDEAKIGAEVTDADIRNSNTVATRTGGRYVITGSITDETDADVVCLLSDEGKKVIRVKTPPGTRFYADLIALDGKTITATYDLTKKKDITIDWTGSFFLRVYSKKGGGAYELSFPDKDHETIEITWTIRKTNPSYSVAISKLELKIPVIETRAPYQEVLKSSITPNYTRIMKDQHKNSYYLITLGRLGPRESREVVMTYTVRFGPDSYYPGALDEAQHKEFTKSEHFIDSNSTYMVDTARSITEGATTEAEKVERIYRYVIGNMTYKLNLENTPGSVAALKAKTGDCTEYSDVIAALLRASGLQARTNRLIMLSNSSALHAVSEVYLAGIGWVLVDGAASYYYGRPSRYVYLFSGRNPSVFTYPGDVYETIRYSDGSIDPGDPEEENIITFKVIE